MANIDVESRVEDLLNPCKFGENLRQQAYVQGNQTNYAPGGTIQIVLPNNGTVDLSNSYVEFDMSLSGNVAGTSLITLIQRGPGAVAADSGNYDITFKGAIITTPSWNTIGTQIAANINDSRILEPYGVTVAGAGVDVNTGITLTWSTAYTSNVLLPDPVGVLGRITGTGATVSIPLFITNTQDYSAPTPRVEKYMPIVNKFQVNFNSQTIVDIPNANRLMALIQQMDSVDDLTGKQYETAYYENGFSITPGQTSRFKIDLSFVDFFKIIHPLQLYNNAQVQINLELEQPRYCLICSDATNSGNQSYLLQNVRLQYHRLNLTDRDVRLLKEKINSSEGLIIPFKSWNSFAGTVLEGQANANIIFNPSRKHFLGIAILVLSQAYYARANNIRKLTTFLRNKIDNYRLRVGDIYFPVDRVNSSNVNYSLVEPLRTLVEFCEVVKNKRIIDDMEVFINYAGNVVGGVSAANDPYYTSFYPVSDENIHTSSAMGILCSDIGYSNLTQLCNRLTLQGVNTGNVPNVVLEMSGMTPPSTSASPTFPLANGNCDVLIFSYAQEYLQILPGSFNWYK